MTSSRPTRRPTPRCAARLLAAALSACPAAVLLSAPSPAVAAADQAVAEQQKWEGRIQFTGEEDTNMMSLRIFDQNAVEEGDFVLRSLWKYDPTKGVWAEVPVPAKKDFRIRLKDRKAEGNPPDSQMLVELPVRVQDVGLYYAHWTVDKTHGTSYLRLGPKAQDRTATGKAGPGQRLEDVPLTIDVAKVLVIPDPKYHTGPDCPPVPEAAKPATPKPAPRAAPKK
ncbi:MAG TPA: hypothetical protein VF796_01680 [Humisphaera sp.]